MSLNLHLMDLRLQSLTLCHQSTYNYSQPSLHLLHFDMRHLHVHMRHLHVHMHHLLSLTQTYRLIANTAHQT